MLEIQGGKKLTSIKLNKTPNQNMLSELFFQAFGFTSRRQKVTWVNCARGWMGVGSCVQKKEIRVLFIYSSTHSFVHFSAHFILPYPFVEG